MNDSVLEQVLQAVVTAGKAILAVRDHTEMVVERKADESPVTQADTAAHHILMSALERLSYGPVLSEEGQKIPWVERQSWQQYWLVDPLDGTKEFVQGRAEFTVNVALIRDGEPIFGVVSAPALEQLYVGCLNSDLTGHNTMAWKARLPKSDVFALSDLDREPLRVVSPPVESAPWRVVGSRLHQSAESQAFLSCFPEYTLMSIGSSLKFCRIAEGLADIYPRMAPTSEWDTAAAHAVLLAAGGEVINRNTGEALVYNSKSSLLNPHFVACAARSPVWYHICGTSNFDEISTAGQQK
ncbi:MAG: 3'(2'),5'-bisphosphate nucleotidase CysQ, partial [Gammaproteobacteria bacterium]